MPRVAKKLSWSRFAATLTASGGQATSGNSSNRAAARLHRQVAVDTARVQEGTALEGVRAQEVTALGLREQEGTAPGQEDTGQVMGEKGETPTQTSRRRLWSGRWRMARRLLTPVDQLLLVVRVHLEMN